MLLIVYLQFQHSAENIFFTFFCLFYEKKLSTFSCSYVTIAPSGGNDAYKNNLGIKNRFENI